MKMYDENIHRSWGCFGEEIVLRVVRMVGVRSRVRIPKVGTLPSLTFHEPCQG